MQRRQTRFAGAAIGVLAMCLLTASVAGATGDRGRHRDRPSCSSSDSHRSTRGSLAVIGLSSRGKLVCVDARSAGRSSTIGKVTGLTTDLALVGIDFRPATGALYGVGDKGGIYTIDTRSAAATLVARMDVMLSGAAFGVDFNPVVDRLRIVSDAQQNLRVDVTTGATLTDLPLSGAGIAGAAYTNNDADPDTATTLYDIDAATDQVSIQAPPNNGTLSPTGKLKVDTSNVVGFDIYSELHRGTTVGARALASLTVAGRSGLYEIDLGTGRAAPRGAFATPVVDIAIPLDHR